MTQAATSPQAANQTRVPYRLKLHHIECCNCSHGCNCQFSGMTDSGPCEFMFGFEVIEGKYGSVSLKGARFVVGGKYPGPIHEGRGDVVVFIDEKASPEQVDAIATILTGQAGGMPWEALAGTVGTLEGPIRKPIEMTVNGNRSGFRIPGIVEMRQTPIKDAVSGNEKEIHIVYPNGGFLWDDGSICTTSAMRIKQGKVVFEHPGRYSSYAVANWTNQA
jgi:hypothetical protein